jgi:integrase
LLLSDFDSAQGAALVEQHLAERYGLLARGHTTRGFLSSPASSGGTRTVPPSDATPRRRSSLRKPRAIHRRTFTDSEVIQILTSNKAPRDQIALRLLLFFGIRKGALRGIQFDDFKPESRELTIVTKGEKIQTLQIVDDAIWELLDELREPGNHYLLPKASHQEAGPAAACGTAATVRRLCGG